MPLARCVFFHTITSLVEHPNDALKTLSAILARTARLLDNIPTTERFSEADRQNAVAILGRIFPEQLRAPSSPGAIDENRGGAEDEGCWGVTAEKKYYEFDSVVIKRTLEPHEWIYNIRGELAVPYLIKERSMNDVAGIEFVRNNTSIPLPRVIAAFHDNGRYYIIQERLPGVQLADLDNEVDRLVVIKELEEYIEILHGIKSNTIGGASGCVCLPDRVACLDRRTDWRFRESTKEEFVFCHNDLNQYNILVDPETLKITGIIDWEYSAFYPKDFEGWFYKRRGYSGPLVGEEDDAPRLLEILKSWSV